MLVVKAVDARAGRSPGFLRSASASGPGGDSIVGGHFNSRVK